MQNPEIIGFIVFLILLAGAFVGWTLRHLMPAQFTDDTKSLASVSTAVVATVSALVLGLLISNANSSFSAIGGEVTTLSGKFFDSTRCCADTGRTQSQRVRLCDSMPNTRPRTCSRIIRQISTWRIRPHTNCSSELKIRYLP